LRPHRLHRLLHLGEGDDGVLLLLEIDLRHRFGIGVDDGRRIRVVGDHLAAFNRDGMRLRLFELTRTRHEASHVQKRASGDTSCLCVAEVGRHRRAAKHKHCDNDEYPAHAASFERLPGPARGPEVS